MSWEQLALGAYFNSGPAAVSPCPLPGCHSKIPRSWNHCPASFPLLEPQLPLAALGASVNLWLESLAAHSDAGYASSRPWEPALLRAFLPGKKVILISVFPVLAGFLLVSGGNFLKEPLLFHVYNFAFVARCISEALRIILGLTQKFASLLSMVSEKYGFSY